MFALTLCMVVLGLWVVIGLITVICACCGITPYLPVPRIKDRNGH